MTNALTTQPKNLSIYNGQGSPIETANAIGKWLYDSNILGLPNEASGCVVALTCMAEGITPIEYYRTYHTIEGRPSMRSDAMLAEFRRLGGRHKVIKRDPDGCAVELTTPDGQMQTFELLWDDCKNEDFAVGKNGEVKHNYAFPRKRMQMLWARVISDGVRTLMPEIVAGVYTPEEMQDADLAAPAPVIQKSFDQVVQAKQDAESEDVPFDPPVEEAKTEVLTDIQLARLEQLIEDLGIPSDKMSQACAKRGVAWIDALKPDDADDMINKLDDMLRSKRSAAAANPTS